MITTSRYAPEEIRLEAKLQAGRSGEKYVARGKKTIEQIAQFARKNGDGHVFIICERRGGGSVTEKINIDPRGRWKWDESSTQDENSI